MTLAASALRDNFNDNAQATAWNASFTTGSATKAETGGQAVFTLPSSTAGSHEAAYLSTGRYDLTGDTVLVNAPTMVSTSVAAAAYLRVALDSSNYLQFIQQSGTLKCQKVVAGVTTDLFSVAYSNSTHRWWRIRESGGTIFFDTSTSASGGASWTNRASIVGLPFAVTSLQVSFGASCGNVASPGSFKVDDYNAILPALTTNWRWTQVEWALFNRFRNVTLAATSGQCYLAVASSVDTSGNLVSPTYYSGPLAADGRTLTAQSTQAAAQAQAVNMPLDGRLELPAQVEARFLRLYHRSITGSSYTIREYYPRRLVQTDDFEAESVRAEQIAANVITAYHIGVVNLDATAKVTAGGGVVVLDNNGVTIAPGLSGIGTQNAIKWTDPATGRVAGGVFGLYASNNAELVCRSQLWAGSVTNDFADVFLEAMDDSNSVNASIRCLAVKGQAAQSAMQFQINGFNEVVVSPGAVLVQNGLNVGTATGAATGEIATSGAITAGGLIQAAVSDAGTTNAATALVLRHRSSGTPAAGFGSTLVFQANDSTTADVSQAEIIPLWVNATHGSRTARVLHRAYDTAAREYMRGEASGSAPMIGFLGAAAVTRPAASGSRGGNAALASLLTALANLGLITDSTSV